MCSSQDPTWHDSELSATTAVTHACAKPFDMAGLGLARCLTVLKAGSEAQQKASADLKTKCSMPLSLAN